MVNNCLEASAGAESLLSPNFPPVLLEPQQQVLEDIHNNRRRKLKPVPVEVIAEVSEADTTTPKGSKRVVSQNTQFTERSLVATEEATSSTTSRLYPVRRRQRAPSATSDLSLEAKNATVPDVLLGWAEDLCQGFANWVPELAQKEEAAKPDFNINRSPTIVSLATQGRQPLHGLDDDDISPSFKQQRKTPNVFSWWCCNTEKVEILEASIEAIYKDVKDNEDVKEDVKEDSRFSKSPASVAKELAALMESSSGSLTSHESNRSESRRKLFAPEARRSTVLLKFVDDEESHDSSVAGSPSSEKGHPVSRFFRLRDDLDAHSECDQGSRDVFDTDGNCKRKITVTVPVPDSPVYDSGLWSPSTESTCSSNLSLMSQSKNSGRVLLGGKVTNNTDAFATQRASRRALALRRQISMGNRLHHA